MGELVAEFEPAGGWPVRPRPWVVAMDFDSGRRTVFGRQGAPPVPLPVAVMASCAAPGYFPPVAVAGRRYIDGGGVSVTNADVLVREHLDEVLVLAPMAWSSSDPRRGRLGRIDGGLRRYATARLEREVHRLEEAGTRVRVVVPTPADLVAMGPNVMNPERRTAVFETAIRTTSARLRQPRAVRYPVEPPTATSA